MFHTNFAAVIITCLLCGAAAGDAHWTDPCRDTSRWTIKSVACGESFLKESPKTSRTRLSKRGFFFCVLRVLRCRFVSFLLCFCFFRRCSWACLCSSCWGLLVWEHFPWRLRRTVRAHTRLLLSRVLMTPWLKIWPGDVHQKAKSSPCSVIKIKLVIHVGVFLSQRYCGEEAGCLCQHHPSN